MRIKEIIILFVAALFSAVSYGSKVTATQTGNWSLTSTWGGNPVPDGTPCYDSIVIPAGITVTVNVQVDLTACPATKVLVYGALNFSTGNKLKLSAGSFVYIGPTGGLQTGGGGGSSNLITIGGTDVWSAGCTGSPPPDCGTITGTDILCVGCSLPIELISFTAQLNSGVVYLNWATASETENDYFMVQRSADGFIWEDLIWVDGALNSNFLIEYAEEDRSPLLGTSYYRLKQVDANGNFSYSDIRVVTNSNFYTGDDMLVIASTGGNQQQVFIYFEAALEGDVQLAIYSMSGAILLNETIMADNEQFVVVTLDSPVSSGIYVVRANRKVQKAFFK